MAESAEYSLAGKRVWVAGHRGMVGSALMRRLEREDCTLLAVDHATLDLTRQDETERWMADARPDAVIVSAARVGGIAANTAAPADFLYDNLMIAANVIHAAHSTGVGKLLFIGSSAVYPRLAEQPMREDALLTGPLEPTHEGYSVAKIAGVKLCQTYRRQHGADFIAALPTNLYGPGDNFDLATAHVVPAMLRRFHEAKEAGAEAVTLWGTGAPRRELMHVDDLADALVFLLTRYSGEGHVNVGVGVDVSIRELATLMREVTGFPGEIRFDTAKPDGAPRKLLDVSTLQELGWRAGVGLEDGVRDLYRWYRDNQAAVRGRS